MILAAFDVFVLCVRCDLCNQLNISLESLLDVAGNARLANFTRRHSLPNQVAYAAASNRGRCTLDTLFNLQRSESIRILCFTI